MCPKKGAKPKKRDDSGQYSDITFETVPADYSILNIVEVLLSAVIPYGLVSVLYMIRSHFL